MILIKTSRIASLFHVTASVARSSRFAGRLAGTVTLGLALAAARAQSAPPTPADVQRLPTTTLQAGMVKLKVEVATTPREREIGLMFRKEMGAYEGMLFVFPQPGVQCFWMRDTLIPLSTAFLADDGTIVNIADMAPMTLESHCSTKPVRYVLEMNQGFFERRGLKPGSKLQGAGFTGG